MKKISCTQSTGSILLLSPNAMPWHSYLKGSWFSRRFQIIMKILDERAGMLKAGPHLQFFVAILKKLQTFAIKNCRCLRFFIAIWNRANPIWIAVDCNFVNNHRESLINLNVFPWIKIATIMMSYLKLQHKKAIEQFLLLIVYKGKLQFY